MIDNWDKPIKMITDKPLDWTAEKEQLFSVTMQHSAAGMSNIVEG